MCRCKFFVEQVEDLVVVDLEVGTLDNEDSILSLLSRFNLLEKLLQTVN